jgi:hypothetical protein
MQAVLGASILINAHIFMTLRVYALSGLNKYIFYGLCAYITVEAIYVSVAVSLPNNKGMRFDYFCGAIF